MTDSLQDLRALLAPRVNLTEDELRHLSEVVEQRRFTPGALLLQESQVGDGAYLILSGMVALEEQRADGQQQALAVLGRGELLGEPALAGEASTISVRAVTEVDTLVLKREQYASLRARIPDLDERLHRHLGYLAIEAALRRASPFARLPRPALWSLARQMRPVRLAAGEVLFKQGDVADALYLIRSGAVDVIRNQKRVGTLGPGDVFGEAGLLTDRPRNASVRAQRETHLLQLTRDNFDAVRAAFPALQAFFGEVTRMRTTAPVPTPAAAPTTSSVPFIGTPASRRAAVALAVGTTLFALLTAIAAWREDRPATFAVLGLGALIGPAVFVLYLTDVSVLRGRRHLLLGTAFLGAALGLPPSIAIQRETGIMPGHPGSALAIAVIEEAAKLLGILWLVRRQSLRFQVDGLLYGAAAGMGFAAVENLLYGFARIETVEVLLATLWLRALLSPFTHGTWTAIICVALWHARTTRSWRASLLAVLAFLIAVALHGLWNWRPFPVPWNFPWLLAVGSASVALLASVLSTAVLQERQTIAALNPGIARGALLGAWTRCRVCGQVSPPGARYCPRCAVALPGTARA